MIESLFLPLMLSLPVEAAVASPPARLIRVSQASQPFNAEDRAALRDVFGGQTRGGAQSINMQYRHKHNDGHWVWILCRAKVVDSDAAGKPRRIVGTDTDVTLLRRRDSDMLQLTNKLKLAIDASGIGVWEFDPVTNVVHWDDRMLEIYGITDGENIRRGELWETYLHPDDLAGALAYSDHCQQHGLDFKRDYRIIRPSGEIRHIRSLAGYVAASSQQGKLGGVNIDVTADYERTVSSLLAGGSDPVITKAPEGAWTHAITDNALN